MVQLRALGVSTVICTAVGVGAWFVLQQSGVGIKPVVEVASVHETIAMAQQQRVICHATYTQPTMQCACTVCVSMLTVLSADVQDCFAFCCRTW